ncbi:MAG: response regulator [Deltaproteobacteria bacterium]|nr:response regulator [Deltaproteobacteria bacterium]
MRNKEETAVSPYRFLIVDDSVFARKNMSKVVEMIGAVVVGEATTGKEGIEQYFKLKPDLVIMDVSMPEMEGLEAMAKIKERDNDARVIIVSSMGYQELVKKALILGAKHFISKPFDPAKAAEIIQFVLKEIKTVNSEQ